MGYLSHACFVFQQLRTSTSVFMSSDTAVRRLLKGKQISSLH